MLMKSLSVCAMLLSLGLFSVGCAPAGDTGAETGTDTGTETGEMGEPGATGTETPAPGAEAGSATDGAAGDAAGTEAP